MMNTAQNSIAFDSILGSATVQRVITGLGPAFRVELDRPAKNGDRRMILCGFRAANQRERIECYTIDASGLETYRGGAELTFSRRVAFEAFEAYHAAPVPPKDYRRPW